MTASRTVGLVALCLGVVWSTSATGDQAAYLSKEAAAKAVNLISAGKEIRHFCAPCGDSQPRIEKIERTESVFTGHEQFYEVKVNGNPVDLAYVYVADGDRWVNAAMQLGLDVFEVPETLSPGGAPSIPDFGQRVYKGKIDGRLGIVMDLTKTGESLSGTYEYDSKGIPIELAGSVNSAGAFTIDESIDGNKTGLFDGTLDKNAETLSGRWLAPSGEKSLAFEAKLISETKSYEINVKEKNFVIEGTVAYPELRMKSTETAKKIGKLIESALRSKYTAFESGIREMAREPGFRSPEEGQPFSFGIDAIEIPYFSEELVSAVASTYEYGGGAHPNSITCTFNLSVRPNGEVRELALKDLFGPASEYIRPLSKYAIAELRKQEAQWVLDGTLKELGEEEMKAFAISPQGIRLYFDAYAAGPYAQGPFTVTVPYSALINVIDKKGPLEPILVHAARKIG